MALLTDAEDRTLMCSFVYKMWRKDRQAARSYLCIVRNADAL